MKGSRTAAACTAAACAAALALAAAARSEAAPSSRDRRFFGARAGVGVEAPLGWNLSLHTGYPTVLCLLVHPGGSRISLAVDATTARDAGALAEESRPGLAAQGIEVSGSSPGPRGGVLLDARVPRRNQVLRQLYLVRPVDAGPGARQAIILTLTTTPADLAAASAALDWTMARLDLEPPVRPDEKREHPDGGL